MLNVHEILVVLLLLVAAIFKHKCGSKSNVKIILDSDAKSDNMPNQCNTTNGTRKTLNRQI